MHKHKIMEKSEYYILDNYNGCDFYTEAPPYDRKEGGKFILDENLSKRDLHYLYHEMHYEGILYIPSKTSEVIEKPKAEAKKK